MNLNLILLISQNLNIYPKILNLKLDTFVSNSEEDIVKEYISVLDLLSSTLLFHHFLYSHSSHMSKQELKYLECNKPGYHYGEALNMLCLEQGCFDKALCCGACVE